MERARRRARNYGVLGENTTSNSTVRKYVRMLALSIKEANTRIVPESKGDFSLRDWIVFVFSEELFLSVRQIAKKVMMSKSTMYHHLTETMKWKLRHLK
jgi:DNA-binding transcriptional ArsR family regulator